MLAVMGGLNIRNHARPRDVLANDLALAEREEVPVLLVGENSKERFHMRDFAAKTIRHAHGASRVGFY